MKNLFAAVEPIEFRQAWSDLMDASLEKRREIGKSYDGFTHAAMFFADRYRSDGNPHRASHSFLRFTELMNMLRKHNVGEEFYRDCTDDPEAAEVHLAIIEAAAVVPFCEDGIDLEDLLAEASARHADIDKIKALFGDTSD